MGNIVEPYTLEELEKAPVDDIWGTNDTRVVVQKEAVAATINDNARLRALIKASLDDVDWCPWCKADQVADSAMLHADACPAFTPEGEVR